MSPLVSVIIPCYNISEHLARCAESVLAQTYRDFELLLINDGSSDTSLEICNHYKQKDDRIRVYTHNNRGVSFTRNRGIREAAGKFIMFIDGDDYVKEDYLEQLINNHQLQALVICGMIKVKNEIPNEIEEYKQLVELYGKGHNISAIDLLASNSLSTPCCKLYEKSLITDNNIFFDESVSYQEDLLFNLTYCRFITSVISVDYYGYYYVEHPVSSTGRYHTKFNYIPALHRELVKIVENEHEFLIIKELLFQSVMKKSANIFHKDSDKSFKEKLMEIREIYRSSYFDFIIGYIPAASVNRVLKQILKRKQVYLLYLYHWLVGIVKNGR